MRKILGGLLLLALIAPLFRCAERDNPFDPANPAFQGLPPVAVLKATFDKNHRTDGNALVVKTPALLTITLSDSSKRISELKSAALYLKRPNNSLDTLLALSVGSLSATYFLTDTGFYQLRVVATDHND